MPSREDLSAFLSEDVVDNIPAEQFEFMEKISILRQINGSLAAHVAKTPHAEEMIESIESSNLFLQPIDIDNDCEWYRLHPMIAEFLSERLRQKGADIAGLHRLASEWFMRAEFFSEAIRHAILSDDLAYAVDILEKAVASVRSIRYLGVFLFWIEHLPENILKDHPRLNMMAAWCYVLTGRPEKAASCLAILEDGNRAEAYRSRIELVKAMICTEHDHSEKVLEIVKPLKSSDFRNEFYVHMLLALKVGSLTMLGRHTEARILYLSAAEDLGKRQQKEVALEEGALIADSALVLVALNSGNMIDAESRGGDFLTAAETQHGVRSVSACTLSALVADALYEMDLLEKAQEALAPRIERLNFSAPEYMYRASLTLGRLLALFSSTQEALNYLQAVEERLQYRGLYRGVALMKGERIRLLGMNDDWRRASSLMDEFDSLLEISQDKSAEALEIEAAWQLSRARIAIRTGAEDTVLECAQRISSIARELNRGRLKVLSDLLRAVALLRQCQAEAAEKSLKSALASGFGLGLRRTYIDEGMAVRTAIENMRPLANPAQEAFRTSLFLSSGITAAAGGETSSNEHPIAATGQRGIMLTRREKDILELLSKSMPNKRIATTLNLSVHTV
ncbi:MAG: LuxR C-terminal-related transcriptional regulator, partial [Parahaliea sp.]